MAPKVTWRDLVGLGFQLSICSVLTFLFLLLDVAGVSCVGIRGLEAKEHSAEANEPERKEKKNVGEPGSETLPRPTPRSFSTETSPVATPESCCASPPPNTPFYSPLQTSHPDAAVAGNAPSLDAATGCTVPKIQITTSGTDPWSSLGVLTEVTPEEEGEDKPESRRTSAPVSPQFTPPALPEKIDNFERDSCISNIISDVIGSVDGSIRDTNGNGDEIRERSLDERTKGTSATHAVSKGTGRARSRKRQGSQQKSNGRCDDAKAEARCSGEANPEAAAARRPTVQLQLSGTAALVGPRSAAMKAKAAAWKPVATAEATQSTMAPVPPPEIKRKNAGNSKSPVAIHIN